MTTLLLDYGLLKTFEWKVIPVLGCRTVVSNGSAEEFLQQLLADDPRLWIAEIHRPQPGATRKLRTRSPFFFDTRIRLPDTPKDMVDEPVVRVENVFGLTASCSIATEDECGELQAEPHSLITISCRDITVMADVLPGKDCLIAVDVWANEMLPMHLVMQRPRRMWLAPHRVSPVMLLPDNIGFAIHCDHCGGAGNVACRTCNGSSEVTCSKCGGSGVYKPRQTCPACNGSGYFIGKYGDRMDCHAGPCDGGGYWPQMDCSTCDGSGYVDCRRCEGSGAIGCLRCESRGRVPAYFSTVDGVYTAGSYAGARVLDPSIVSLFDWQQSQDFALSGGVERLFEQVLSRTASSRQSDPVQQFKLYRHCSQLEGLSKCLDRSMATQGVLEAKPIGLTAPTASTGRSDNGIVYEFGLKESRGRTWICDGLPPFPMKTPIKFVSFGQSKAIDLPYQDGVQGGGMRLPPSLVECQGKGDSYRLLIRFPVEIDVERLPDYLAIKADAIPPAEIAEMRHLRRWCARDNRDHPVLNALVFPDEEMISLPEPNLFNKPIADCPEQYRAVQLGVSDQALGLIKGPPGTGKTTVITEIVRQLVARGQKVLVCSQTHQAVRNVLEKLHRIGGVRMARHASEKKRDELSEIEKLYLSGGGEDSYYRSVLATTRKRLADHESRIDFLDVSLKAMYQARDAASELKDCRMRSTEALDALANAFREETDQAAVAFDEKISAIIQSEKHAVDQATNLLTIKQRSAKRKDAAMNLCQGRMSKARTWYVRKTGRVPSEVTTASSWLQKLLLGPLLDHWNWAIGPDVIERRYSHNARKVRDIGVERTELQELIDGLTKEIEAYHAERAKRESQLREDHDGSQAESKVKYDRSVQIEADQMREAERRLIAVQTCAISCSTEFDPTVNMDATPATWQGVIDKASQELQSRQERHNFMSEWARDVEADPESVLDCHWENMRVFFSTCVGVSSWRRLIRHGRDSIDLVIIDEAAHATVSQTLVPMLYAKRVLLIGDEMQLPPTPPGDLGECGECPRVDGDEAPVNVPENSSIANAVRMADCWLERSLFEWISRMKRDIPRVILDTQFRMHPSIADFVGSVFYPEGLTTSGMEKDRDVSFADFSRPVCLISTSAYSDRYEDFLDPGYRNSLEARLVHRVLERAEADLLSPQEVGIITPYAHQVQTIRRMLDQFMQSAEKVQLQPGDIASVDSFQGSERDIVIISFARSPKDCPRCQGGRNKRKEDRLRCRKCGGRGWLGTGLAFARDLRRLNVAFSRAKKMLILVGDIDALTNQRFRGGMFGGRVLSRFRDYVADHGKVVHVWERSNIE